jgi:hypothetical protein
MAEEKTKIVQEARLSVARKTSPFRAGMDSADGVAVRF